ncbi:MAG: carbohydrate kinase family protein [Myxococcales bacterium]|nr:carbohydrate kinase family protein [Myxococcales bacterium]
MTDLLHRLRASFGRPFDLLGLGECSLDFLYRVPLALSQPLPDKASALGQEVLGGGQIATACAAAARLGLRARFVGAVGDDDAGAALRSELAREPVDTSRMKTCSRCQTRTALILLGQSGERSVIEWRDPALTLPIETLSAQDVAEARMLHVDLSFPSASLWAAEQARAHGLIVSVDLDRPAPHCAELLRLTDLCVVSEHFPARFTHKTDPEQAALALSHATPGQVIVTQGDRGCWLVDGPHIRRFPAFAPPQLLDTTACGDTFHAALLAALLTSADQPAPVSLDHALPSAIRFASAAAALKCADLGRRGCPSRAQVDRFLHDAPPELTV